MEKKPDQVEQNIVFRYLDFLDYSYLEVQGLLQNVLIGRNLSPFGSAFHNPEDSGKQDDQ